MIHTINISREYRRVNCMNAIIKYIVFIRSGRGCGRGVGEIRFNTSYQFLPTKNNVQLQFLATKEVLCINNI